MADVPVIISKSIRLREGASPSNPVNIGTPQEPLNPDGSVTGPDLNKVSYNIADSKTGIEKQRARDNIATTSGIPQIISTTGIIDNLIRTSNNIFFTGLGEVTLRSISDPVNGEEVSIVNLTGVVMTLGTGASSPDTARFDLPYQLPNNKFFIVKYYDNRWRISVPFSEFFISLERFQFKVPANATLGTSDQINIQGQTDIAERFVLSWGGLTTAAQGGAKTKGTIETPRATLSSELMRFEQAAIYLGFAASTVGQIDNFNIPSGRKVQRWSQGNDITGVANGEVYRTLFINNSSTSLNLTIKNNNAASLASNRFEIGSDLIILPGETYQFIYLTSRWRIIK